MSTSPAKKALAELRAAHILPERGKTPEKAKKSPEKAEKAKKSPEEARKEAQSDALEMLNRIAAYWTNTEDNRKEFKARLFNCKSLELSGLPVYYPKTEDYVFQSDKPKSKSKTTGPKLTDENQRIFTDVMSRVKYLLYMDTVQGLTGTGWAIQCKEGAITCIDGVLKFKKEVTDVTELGITLKNALFSTGQSSKK